MRARLTLPAISLALAVAVPPAEARAEVPPAEARADWITPGKIQDVKPASEWQKPGEIQTPGEIQVPKGPWLTPGDIQVPKGIQAVKSVDETCTRRITVVGDALFDFDKSELRSDAEVTLAAAGPEIAEAGRHKVTVNGHTDAVGSDAYNDKLSEARARTVRDWLSAHGFVPADTPIKGYGEREPITPNTLADGKDNPEGRQKNRRVEIDIDTCD